MVQPSYLYMMAKKTIALTIQIFISKLVSLLFNTLSRFPITFLPRSNCLLILWLESPGASIQIQIKRESYKYYLVLLCLSVTISCLVLSFFFWPELLESAQCMHTLMDTYVSRQSWDSDCGYHGFWRCLIVKMLISFYFVEQGSLETVASQVIVFLFFVFFFLISNSYHCGLEVL